MMKLDAQERGEQIAFYHEFMIAIGNFPKTYTVVAGMLLHFATIYHTAVLNVVSTFRIELAKVIVS